MKKIAIVVTLACLTAFGCRSQVFFHRLDVSTGNLYSFVVSNLLSAGINYLTQDRLLDTSFGYTHYKTDYNSDQLKIKGYNRLGLTMRDLIADSSYGVKLGYQSSYPGIFNWGVYGSAHYKINRFKMEYAEERMPENVQRFQVGGGVLLAFGAVDSRGKAVIEIGLRYNLPTYYKGALGDNPFNVLNKGLTSHYSLRFGGFGILQGVGLFAEIPHYNLVKENVSFSGLSVKPFTFGVTYTIMPWSKED